jgi:hypothetical protein
MVRVWYEPPPYGPATDLNRSGYGIHGGGLFKTLLERASKGNQPLLLSSVVLFSMAICYIPLCTFCAMFAFCFVCYDHRMPLCLASCKNGLNFASLLL